LSVIPLGHRTYPKPKGVRENSMFGKAGYGETAKPYAGRDPDGMVKAILLEPQCPYSKRHWPGLAVETRDSS
jgi:hypothetical protein